MDSNNNGGLIFKRSEAEEGTEDNDNGSVEFLRIPLGPVGSWGIIEVEDEDDDVVVVEEKEVFVPNHFLKNKFQIDIDK